MTNILQLPSTTSSNPSLIQIPLLKDNSPVMKSSAPILIQAPTFNSNNPNTLLIKRLNPVELGDMLMKKIKNKTVNSEGNSSPQDSNFEGNSYNSPNTSGRQLENIEGSPMAEDMVSPFTKSISDEIEIPSIAKFSFSQKNSPVPTKVTVKSLRPVAKDNHLQVQQALGALQKKMLFNQVASLREALFKEQLAQEPLYIPPLLSISPAPQVKQIREENFFNNDDEDHPKVIIGPIEYPLLSMAPQESGNNNTNNLLKVPMLLNQAKTSTNSHRSLLGSLCVTRAETQRSESDEAPCSLGDEFLQAIDAQKKRGRKTKEEVANEKVKKTQGKQAKGKGKGKGKNDSYLSESSQSP